MTHTQLTYFVAVAGQLSLTRVAEQFHVSQPAVSAAIRDLEKEFQVTLFERRRNALVLTPGGENIYHRAKALLVHYHEFYNSLSADLAPKNSCSVSFAPNVATLHLANLYRYAREAMPEFTVTLLEETVDNMTHMLKNNLLDTACFSSSSNTFDPALNYIAVGEMVLSMCAHPSVFYSEGTIIPVSALKDVPIVLQQRTSLQNIYTRNIFRDAGITPNIIYESHQNSTMRTMVCRGIALGCNMPAALFQNDKSIRIYQLENQEPLPLYFVYKEKTPDVTTFLRLIKGYFKQGSFVLDAKKGLSQ